mmetsp:Transcript_3626/g.3577  ORF Transcript_3626/g.3577 Transcript_3626/m.3577 type:complete len:123 (-) Transcript_3626:150-518(-)
MATNLLSNTVEHSSSSSLVSSKALLLHASMYGLNLYSEINQLRQQHQDNKYKVFYFSKAINSFELFVEFFYEILNEKHEPLIAVVEFVKAYVKLREYYALVNDEKINSYIPLETYKDFKRLQ